MNIFKKLFSKKKIEMVDFSNGNNSYELNVTLLESGGKKNKEIITVLCVFGNSYVNDYHEILNTNTVNSLIKLKDDNYYLVISSNLDDYKTLINSLDPNNKFFKPLLNLLHRFDMENVEEFYADGLLELFKYSKNEYPNSYYLIIKKNVFNLKDIFSIDELCRVLLINEKYTIYNYMKRYDNSDNSKEDSIEFLELQNIFGGEFLYDLKNSKYKEDIGEEDIEEFISEDIGEEEIFEIKENENGDLIYNKEQYM